MRRLFLFDAFHRITLDHKDQLDPKEHRTTAMQSNISSAAAAAAAWDRAVVLCGPPRSVVQCDGPRIDGCCCCCFDPVRGVGRANLRCQLECEKVCGRTHAVDGRHSKQSKSSTCPAKGTEHPVRCSCATRANTGCCTVVFPKRDDG